MWTSQSPSTFFSVFTPRYSSFSAKSPKQRTLKGRDCVSEFIEKVLRAWPRSFHNYFVQLNVQPASKNNTIQPFRWYIVRDRLIFRVKMDFRCHHAEYRRCVMGICVSTFEWNVSTKIGRCRVGTLKYIERSRFNPTPLLIKQRIEKLIEREFAPSSISLSFCRRLVDRLVFMAAR